MRQGRIGTRTDAGRLSDHAQRLFNIVALTRLHFGQASVHGHLRAFPSGENSLAVAEQQSRFPAAKIASRSRSSKVS
jgi:hypothetical protein